MMFAVAGATMKQRDPGGERDVLDVGVGAARELVGDHPPPGDRLERHLADEPPRGARHDGGHLVAALLQLAHDLDRLVGADAAAYAQAL